MPYLPLEIPLDLTTISDSPEIGNYGFNKTTPSWVFILARSPQAGTGDLPTRIGWLKARDKKVEIVQARPGSCSFNMRLTDNLAYDIEEHRTCVLCVRNKQVVWSGPVWNLNEDAESNTLTVSCLGWMQDIHHRIVRDSQTQEFNLANADVMAYALLGKANAQIDTMTGTLRPTRLRQGTAFLTEGALSYPTFSRKYERGNNIGQGVQELSDVENGYDMDVNPLTRELDLWYPRRGVVRSNIALGYRAGPRNLKNVVRNFDSVRQVNRMTTYGRDGSAVAEDPESMDYWGVMLEEEFALSDVQGTNATDILLGYAGAEVAIRKDPVPGHTLTLFPNKKSLPVFKDDFDVGDTVKFSAKRGRMVIDRQPVRIFGVSISIDNEGREVIDNIQITPSGA